MSSDPRRATGRAGEDLAAEHLERRGIHVIARNHRTRHGEIDLIGYDGRAIVFCEVKTRRSGMGAPLDAIGPAKQARLRRLAMAWLAETADRPRGHELRFDAIGIILDARGRLHTLDHVEGAF